MSRSHELPLASCKRILLEGAPKAVSRMGAGATVEARNQLEMLLKDLAKHCHDMLQLTKRNTVNVDILKNVVGASLACKGINTADLSHQVRKGAGERGLPVAAVVRLFKKALGNKSRVTEEAQLALVGACEAYLKNLGHKAAALADAGKRRTIQPKDVSVAARM